MTSDAPLPQRCDVAIVGGGHNALVAAAYLARAGLDVVVLERDTDGSPCIEAKAPQDVEAALAMPGGHIFHGDLGWPWRTQPADEPAARWGVATDHPRLLMCGSGAQRGGAVSGIGGQNAAMALLEARG